MQDKWWWWVVNLLGTSLTKISEGSHTSPSSKFGGNSAIEKEQGFWALGSFAKTQGEENESQIVGGRWRNKKRGVESGIFLMGRRDKHREETRE
jgi:hypothetical protein